MKRGLSPTDANNAPPSKRLKLSTSADTSEGAHTTGDNNNAVSSTPSRSRPSDTSPFFGGTSAQPAQSPFKPKSFALSYSATPHKKISNISLHASTADKSAPSTLANGSKNNTKNNTDPNESGETIGSKNQSVDEQVKRIKF